MKNNISIIVLPEEKSRVTFLSGVAIIANNFLQSFIPQNNVIPIPIYETIRQSLQNCTDILLMAYSSQETERRLRLLVSQLNANFLGLNKKIDKIDVKYSIILEKVIRETIQTQLDEKIKLYADVLTNGVSLSIDESLVDWMLNDIFSLTSSHILFLGEAIKYRESAEFKQQPFAEISDIGKLIGFENDILQKVAKDLLNKGILNDPMVGTYGYSGFSQFGVSKYGRQLFDFVKKQQ